LDFILAAVSTGAWSTPEHFKLRQRHLNRHLLDQYVYIIKITDFVSYQWWNIFKEKNPLKKKQVLTEKTKLCQTVNWSPHQRWSVTTKIQTPCQHVSAPDLLVVNYPVWSQENNPVHEQVPECVPECLRNCEILFWLKS
jgi:hypothetical protein